METVQSFLEPGWVSSAIGLVGLVVALWLYRASRVGARPVYQRRALRLIGADEEALPQEVEIRFRGEPVNRLTKAYVVLWNSGKTLVRGSDIVAEDPLRAECSEGSRILDVRVLKVRRDTNKFEAKLDPAKPCRVLIVFDYLDPGDGAVVEILHTDSNRYPDIRGTIRGVPRGIVDWGRLRASRSRELAFPFSIRSFLATFIVFGLIAVGIGAVLPDPAFRWFFSGEKPPDPDFLRGFFIGLGSLYAGFPILILWLRRRRFPRSLTTTELEE